MVKREKLTFSDVNAENAKCFKIGGRPSSLSLFYILIGAINIFWRKFKVFFSNLYL